MGWPLNAKLTVLLALGVAFFFGITPSYIINRTWFLLYHSPTVLFSSLRVPPPAPHTLKAAILNVTTDFNELSRLVQEFMDSHNADPTIETAFRSFLAERASRSHPGLENILDWILSLYKFAFPFIIISFLAKLTGGGSDDNSAMLAAEHSGGRGGSPHSLQLATTNSKRLAAKILSRHSSRSPSTPDTPNDWDGSTKISRDVFGNIMSRPVS
jgi:hypothetical protein